MFWLRLFQFAGMLLLFAFVITQILIPAVMSRKLFPLFRKAEGELSTKYAELNQQLHEVDLKDKVNELEKKLHPITPSVTPTPTEQKSETTQS